MASDLEKLLLGLVSAAEGYQGRRQSDRELLLRMSERDLAKRKELRDERRSRLQEFEELGAPLDVIERGQRLRPPTTIPTPRGDVTVGQDFTERDRADRGAYEGFLSRMQAKAQRREGSDQALTTAISELGQLREIQAVPGGKLTPEQQKRLLMLERFVDERRGLGGGAAPAPAAAAASTEAATPKPGLLQKFFGGVMPKRKPAGQGGDLPGFKRR